MGKRRLERLCFSSCALTLGGCLDAGVKHRGDANGMSGCGQGYVDVNDDTGLPGAFGHTWAVASTTNCGAAKVDAAMSVDVRLYRAGQGTACDLWTGTSWDGSAWGPDAGAGGMSAPCDIADVVCYNTRADHHGSISGRSVGGGPYWVGECE